MTPYYADDSVTLYLGDMREVLPTLDIKPDCVVTDPPYGETNLAWDRWPAAWPGAVAAVTSSMWCFGSMRMFLDRQGDFGSWKLSQDVVWRKEHGTGIHADRFRRFHEMITHWYHGPWRDIHHDPPRITATWDARIGPHGTVTSISGPIYSQVLNKWSNDGTRLPPSVIDARSMYRRGPLHPTEKPVGILRPLIEYACPPGGLVLDPFAGSGSTAEAARTLGRRTVLIEANKRYCEAIAARLSQGVLDLAVADTRPYPTPAGEAGDVRG